MDIILGLCLMNSITFMLICFVFTWIRTSVGVCMPFLLCRGQRTIFKSSCLLLPHGSEGLYLGQLAASTITCWTIWPAWVNSKNKKGTFKGKTYLQEITIICQIAEPSWQNIRHFIIQSSSPFLSIIHQDFNKPWFFSPSEALWSYCLSPKCWHFVSSISPNALVFFCWLSTQVLLISEDCLFSGKLSMGKAGLPLSYILPQYTFTQHTSWSLILLFMCVSILHKMHLEDEECVA